MAGTVTETPKKDGWISTMQYAFKIVGPNVRFTQLAHIYTAVKGRLMRRRLYLGA